MKLLCLSNGHGEDTIAVRILQELQQQSVSLEIAALPLVGEGRAYQQLQIPIVGPVQAMPSGGFIYMDSRQLARDLKHGLIRLTLAQYQVVKTWAKAGAFILAIGDIFPLTFAWLSGAPYAFVGSAKSEYHLRDEAGFLPHRPWSDVIERWFGSVYLPWERWLMSRPRCKAVFPRDQITTKILRQWPISAFDLGNPMMDHLQPSAGREIAALYNPDAELQEVQRSLTLLLLPGSRPTEAYANWQQMMQAVAGVTETLWRRPLLFLGAIAPALNLSPLVEALTAQGWHPSTADLVKPPITDPEALYFTQNKATLILTQKAFNDCLHQADLAIAMAGTATEQFVGLGKPAIAIPGEGPQFTHAFAEAQTRLLGPSVVLVEQPAQVIRAIQSLLSNPDRLQLIAENGRLRMGAPGAAKRIAACLIEQFQQ